MTTITEKYSLSEYFQQEIESQTRHEYIDGKIVAMTGGTPNHNRIIVNLLVALHTALRDQSYAVFVTDQRLWIPERRIATYPDIMIMSERLSYQEGRKDTLINPILITKENTSSPRGNQRGNKISQNSPTSRFDPRIKPHNPRMV